MLALSDRTDRIRLRMGRGTADVITGERLRLAPDMYPWLVSDPDDQSEPIRRMRQKLDEFYATTNDYPAFETGSDNSVYYQAIEPYLRSTIDRRGRARVLELGTGRPTFGTHFAAIRDKIEYHVQDVTPKNRQALAGAADRVWIGDIADVRGEFDLIFSTFVFEHVSAPRPFLEGVRNLLAAGGTHFIFCPRYDQPGYLCPSLRYHGPGRQLGLKCFFAASRLLAMFDRRPRFWVNSDPAVFHRPFFRDADAVHIVSRGDVERWHRSNGFEVHRIALPATGWRAWILRRLLTLSLACTKTS